MKSRLFFILFTLCSFSFWGCDEPVSPDQFSSSDPKLVINSELNSGAGFSIEVSRSVAVFNGFGKPSILSDVNVVLSQSGNRINLQYFPDSGRWESPLKPEPGKKYEISVEKKGFITVYSQTTIPHSPPGLKTEMIPNGGKDRTGQSSDLLRISFNDPGSEKNFYEINFFYYNSVTGLFLPFVYVTNDATLNSTETVKTNYGAYVFSDILFNGKYKEFTAVPDFGLANPGASYKYLIVIKSLSEEYFKYMKTLNYALEGGGNNLFGPVGIDNAKSVFSNIDNGFGIFAGTFVKRDTLK